MSMYQLVFPDDHRSERVGMLVALIGEPTDLLTKLRLRDAWIERGVGPNEGEPIIALYTRNGGGNREHYHDQNEDGRCNGCAGEAATTHPSYLIDNDDDFDSTYRTYRFRVGNPVCDAEIKATMLEIASPEPIDMSEVWTRVLDELNPGMSASGEFR